MTVPKKLIGSGSYDPDTLKTAEGVTLPQHYPGRPSCAERQLFPLVVTDIDNPLGAERGEIVSSPLREPASRATPASTVEEWRSACDSGVA